MKRMSWVLCACMLAACLPFAGCTPKATNVTTPDVVGQTQAAASTVIVDAGLAVGVVTQAYSATVASGSVISQTPSAGTSASPGTAVALTVSMGPQPVPDVTGQDQLAAYVAIVGAGLRVGAVTQVYSATAASGSVIGQSPAGGTWVSPGTAVALTVSMGPQPAPVAVPDVAGQTLAAANAAVTDANLTTGTVTQAYSTTMAFGLVISQFPAAGVSVNPGTAVALTVSMGPQPTVVPDAAGLAHAVASTLIVRTGLAVGAVTQAYSATVESGFVISQTPIPGSLVSPGTAVALTVSMGPQPAPVAVPDVAGQTLASATTVITSAGLTAGVVTQAFSATVAFGSVVSQSPAAGSLVNAGASVALTLSQGPQPVSVPGVTGQSQAAAAADITGAGLTVGTVSQAYSATIAAGLVIGQSPTAGTLASPGAAVALTVSQGPQPATVPSVAGLTQTAADAAITGADLTVGTVTLAYSATVALGDIISQSPAAGTLVSHGTTVALTVSKGPQPRIVPDVAGQTQAAATITITGAGLTVGSVTQDYSSIVAVGAVMSQTPAAGASASPGSPVALIVSQGPPPVPVPDVTGQTQSAAGAVLTGAGLAVGAITEKYSLTVTPGSVISQLPTAGTLVIPGSAVALTVAKSPEPVAVPDVVGHAQEEAETDIIDANLAVGKIKRECSDTVEEGLVLRQDPAAETQALSGSPVALTVSDGPCNEVVLLPEDMPLEMVKIPVGTFTMGSPGTETDRNPDEGPQHSVALDGFWIGKYAVTQAQWKAMVGGNPSYFQDGQHGIPAGTDTDSFPVENVSWNDAQTFANALNAHITATSQGAAAFRLPTEAEWEYACRAETMSRFYWGDDPSYTVIVNYAWHSDNGGNKTHEVGLLLPNAWGLFDMSGNVSEWCMDRYGPYAADDQTNPTGSDSGWLRVFRGGNAGSNPAYCRSASRNYNDPSYASGFVGFRLVRNY